MGVEYNCRRHLPLLGHSDKRPPPGPPLTPAVPAAAQPERIPRLKGLGAVQAAGAVADGEFEAEQAMILKDLRG
jgi:hypothetical protein